MPRKHFTVHPSSKILASTRKKIKASDDFDDYADEIKEISQEFTSENTSINSKKLPAIFNMVQFEPGTTNLDYGGGKFDNVAEYLTQYDVVNLVYDPYNRSPEHNKEVIKTLRDIGGADTVTCSNVLNVIKEPEVRKNVLENIKKLVKPGGKVYITVYEGDTKKPEGPTKSGYQLNRKTGDYMEEIQEVFPDAKRKGKLISVNASTRITAARFPERPLEPPDEPEIERIHEKSVIDDVFNFTIEVQEHEKFGYEVGYADNSWAESIESDGNWYDPEYDIKLSDPQSLWEDIDEMFYNSDECPREPGEYQVSLHAELVYDIEIPEVDGELYTSEAEVSYNWRESKIDNIVVTPIV